MAGLDSNLSAIFEIKNTQYNGYEITTSFLVDFFTPQPGIEGVGNCEGIEGTGEERVVYLVNKMKEQREGEYQYIINLPQKAIAVTQVLVFLLLMLLTRNIKYRRFSPFPFNAVFALLYAAFLFVIVYLEVYLDSSLLITFWVVLSLALMCSTVYIIDLLLICFSKMAAIVTVSVLMSLCLGAI